LSNDQVILKALVEEKVKEISPGTDVESFFELFSALEILKDYDLSYDEIEGGLLGKGADGGMDSAYIFFNNELMVEDSEAPLKKKNEIEFRIIQSKMSDGFSETGVEKLQSSARDLFNLQADYEALKSVYNKEVLATFKRFSDLVITSIRSMPQIKIRYAFVTFGTEVHPNVQRKVDQLKRDLKTQFNSAEVHFDFIGANDLLNIVRRTPITNYVMDLSDGPITTTEGSYIFLTDISSYYTFLVDGNNGLNKRLFESNVRDYQGNVKVNAGIQESLTTVGQEDFWCLNNGVTILASSATAMGKKLQIEDPQIVNGLQTSYEIYNYFSKRQPYNETRRVLVRVIKQNNSEGRDRIIRATNSQTTIPEASLRGADKIQRDIEDYFSQNGYFYDRRKNFYKNAGKEMDKIVSISFLAQSVLSILLSKPDYARARPSTLINSGEDYQLIFNDRYPVNMYLNCVQLMRTVDHSLKNIAQFKELDRKDLTNLKFYVCMAAANLLMGKCTSVTVADIDKIDLTKNDKVKKAIDDAIEICLEVYNSMGATDKAAKSREMTEHVVAEIWAVLQQKKTTG
jgi:hypothetical protein